MRDLERVPRDQMSEFERAYFDRVRAEVNAALDGGLCIPCFDAAVDHDRGCVAPREPLFPIAPAPRLPSEVRP